MNGDSSLPDDSADDGNESMKPNCTITGRQDQMLDQLKAERYASRSEALRIAIEDLHQKMENDSEQPIRELLTKAERILETLEEVAEQVSELHPNRAPSRQQPTPDRRSDGPSEPPTPAVSDADEDDRTDERVYTAVSKLGLASESRISEECEVSQLRIHESLLRLIERGLVTTVEDDQTVQYRPAPATE